MPIVIPAITLYSGTWALDDNDWDGFTITLANGRTLRLG